MTHGMMRAMFQATKREISVSRGRIGGDKREETKRERMRERRGEREEIKEKEKEREKGREKEGVGELLPLIYRSSDSQSLSGRELKSVYSTRPMLQEVRILPTWVSFHSKHCLAVFSTLRGCLAGFFL